MKTTPLKSISLDEAIEKQFRLIDEICHEFQGSEILNLGDLGVVKELNKPNTAQKVERVLARYFHSEKCVLVTGAGTGAIRMGLQAMIKPNSKILVHDAPVYPTTLHTLNSMNVELVKVDFNDINEIKKVVNEVTIDGVIIQTTRQKIEDSYLIKDVIEAICSIKKIPILTDDNYAVMKIDKIGVELGATCSAFSAFKLLGPEGVGILVGDANVIEQVDHINYSGGSKVQGWQAIEVLRGLVYAPVALAIQARVVENVFNRLKNKEISEIKNVYIANAQSKVLIVEFVDEINAEKILVEAEKLGAAPNPVGAESKYEMTPMFYRVSGTFIAENEKFKDTMIRINPMRSGEETIIRILKESIEKVKICS